VDPSLASLAAVKRGRGDLICFLPTMNLLSIIRFAPPCRTLLPIIPVAREPEKIEGLARLILTISLSSPFFFNAAADNGSKHHRFLFFRFAILAQRNKNDWWIKASIADGSAR
jgi:hypothetical protein